MEMGKQKWTSYLIYCWNGAGKYVINRIAPIEPLEKDDTQLCRQKRSCLVSNLFRHLFCLLAGDSESCCSDNISCSTFQVRLRTPRH